jgi:hypothetical protein
MNQTEYIIDTTIKDIREWENLNGTGNGIRYTYNFKIDINGNVNVTRCNGTLIYKSLSVNDNIPIPKYWVNLLKVVTFSNTKPIKSAGFYKNNNTEIDLTSDDTGCVKYMRDYTTSSLYMRNLEKTTEIIDYIKIGLKEENTNNKLREQVLKCLKKELEEINKKNKELEEKNLILTNKNEIYEKKIKELEEKNKCLKKENMLLKTCY